MKGFNLLCTKIGPDQGGAVEARVLAKWVGNKRETIETMEMNEEITFKRLKALFCCRLALRSII